MARIELRNSKLRLVDGYSNTAAVNGSPTDGDTEVSIDTVEEVDPKGDGSASSVIPVSSRFTVVGSEKVHTITAQDANAQLDIDFDGGTGTFTITIDGEETASLNHDDDTATIQAAIDGLAGVSSGDFTVTLPTSGTVRVKAESDGAFGDTAVTMSGDISGITGGSGSEEAVQTYDGGVTHDITFTPAFKTATGVPSDDAVITVTGRTLEINIGDGAAEYTENREFTYDLNRSLLDAVRQGNDIPMDVSLDFVWDFLTAIDGADTPTISDVLHRRGAASGWKTSSSDICEPYAIDIEIEHTPPCGGDAAETITLPDFRWESLPHNLVDAQISMTGRCNATEALVVRGA